MTSRWYFVVVCICLGEAACLWLREPDELSVGSADATTSSGGGGDATPSGSSGTSGASSGGGGSSGSSGVDGAGPHCTGERGPVAVHVGETANCIDATEVTIRDYKEFFAVANPDSGQDARCGWNEEYNSLTQLDLGSQGDQAKPIHGIDWCDAVAYCAWAGKRLCAGADGLPIESVKVGYTTESPEGLNGEWYTACSANDTRTYPYGNEYDGTQCVVDAGGPADIGEVRCEGGYPGIYDLNGNVREWTDHCTPAEDGGGPETQSCLTRGGGFQEGESTYECKNLQARVRADWAASVGFRCCSSWVVP